MKFNFKNKDGSIKIYIDDIIHISLKREDIIGFQSWIEGDDTKRYIIEYYTKHNSNIYTGYNEEIKWKSVLKLLDEIDFYSHYKVE